MCSQMERNETIDFIKFFAIFFVATIHTKTVSGLELGAIHGDDINFAINTFARFAVPFFFVTSGFLFVQKLIKIEKDKTESVTKAQFSYLKKYVLKLTKLYAAWFVFYFLFNLAVNFIETEKNSAALQDMFMQYIGNFDVWNVLYYGSGWPEYHLWFLPALIWAIVLLFVFAKLKRLKVLLIGSLVLNIYGLFGQSYSFIHETPLDTRDAVFFALFYVTLGGVVARYSATFTALAKKIPTSFYMTSLICLSAIQIVEGYVTLRVYGGNAENYYITTIPLLICLFLFVIKHAHIGKNKWVTKIGENAVGIYVSHVFIMKTIRILMQRLDLASVEDTILWNIIFTPLVFIVAYFFYAGLQRGEKIMQSSGKGKHSARGREEKLEYR